jgi:hypothetical protein
LPDGVDAIRAAAHSEDAYGNTPGLDWHHPPPPGSSPAPGNPTFSIPTALHIARLALLVPAIAVFLLPGCMLGWVFRTPFAVITSFLGSAALLFNLILLLDALRLPVELFTVSCAFAAATCAIALWAARRPLPVVAVFRRPGMPAGSAWIWMAPPALAVASLAASVLFEPLAGFDNVFRWDYLARLILTHHSLGAYPPIRMEDFELYSWCDGIPPLAPFLNFLIYAVAGSTSPQLISIRAVSEFLLLALLVYRFAGDFWGRAAGWASLAVLGSSALFIWGLAIEQETGLTAISLVAMVYLISASGNEGGEAGAAALWAGVAAGVGALSREYGLYFVILGAFLLRARGKGRLLGRFLVPAALVAAPWYLRNWIRTGNPVYPALGAIFPTNKVHVEIMRDISGFWGFGSSPVPLSTVPWALLATAGTVGILALAGICRAGTRCLAIVSAMLLVVLLWIWSMPETAGGWNYSMRVLLPVIALGAVLGGWIGTTRGWIRNAMALLLALASVDAARRAWLLPDLAVSTPWTLSFSEWRLLHAENSPHSGGNLWEILAKVAGDRFIVVDSPGAHVGVTEAGGHATPFESPRFAPALDPSLSVEEAVRRLRMARVRFVMFSVRNPVIDKFVQRHATLRHLASDYEPVTNLHGLLIFDLEFLTRKKDVPAVPGPTG